MKPHSRFQKIVAARGLPAIALISAVAGIGHLVFANDEDPLDRNELPGATPTPTESPVRTERVIYEAELQPANANVSGVAASGTVRVVVDGESFGVSIESTGLAPNIHHPQHLHSGTRCAGLEADTNDDGIIDVVEASSVSGPPIVSFTLAPRAFELGDAKDEAFPVAGPDGSLSYIGTSGLSSILSAIGSVPVPTPTSTNGPIVASPTAAPPSDSLEGRVVQIHAVSPNTQLPATVESSGGQPASSTLPVACATLTRIAPRVDPSE